MNQKIFSPHRHPFHGKGHMEIPTPDQNNLRVPSVTFNEEIGNDIFDIQKNVKN